MKSIGTPASGAIFSDDLQYRYRLWRVWNFELPRALFLLLNPSTADEIRNDPTVERQFRRVQAWSTPSLLHPNTSPFGSIEIINACAFRSTDPDALYQTEDPVGDDNADHIHDAIRETIASGGILICGWGSHLTRLYLGKYSLHHTLLESLETYSYPLAALQLNQDGSPQHPLYLSYSLKPRRWAAGELHETLLRNLS